MAKKETPEDVNFDTLLDDIEKKVGILEGMSTENEARMPTGSLALDLVLGGGITAAWYTNYGAEQTCKTTSAMMILMSAVRNRVPIIYEFDYEGSTSSSMDYLESIKNTMKIPFSLEEIFGKFDHKGNVITRPRARVKSPEVAETFFDFVASIARRLPDKVYKGGEWWLIYEDNKDNRARIRDHHGNDYDQSYFKQNGTLRVPAENGSLQALFVVDSYPAMMPQAQDVDDPKSGMAAKARMFAEQIPRILSKLKSKRIAIVGVNQLREKPGVAFGDPRYEPGGTALKFASSVRLQYTDRALSGAPDAIGTGGRVETEASWDGEGQDTYRYIHVKAVKNKLSTPYLETWLRVWTTDSKDEAHGFDPAYDTFYYMRATGQLEGDRKRMLLKLAGNEAKKPISWRYFKTLVLGDKTSIKELCEAIGMRPTMIRAACEKQMQTEKGLDMFHDQRRVDAEAKKLKEKAKKDKETADA